MGGGIKGQIQGWDIYIYIYYIIEFCTLHTWNGGHKINLLQNIINQMEGECDFDILSLNVKWFGDDNERISV